MKSSKLKKYLKLFIWICILIIPKVMIALKQNPIRVGDELGTIAAPAYFAGLDWSDLWGIVAYYGTGYHIIFTPIFKITNNPYIIYRAILISYVILEAVVGIVVYYIIKKYFVSIKDEEALGISIIISYFQHNKVTWISNESIIFLIIWLTIFICILLLKNIDNKKKKTFYTFILCLLLAYSLTVHTRLAIMYAAIILVFIYVYVCIGKILVAPYVAILMTIVLGGGALAYNDWVQQLVWLQYRESEYLHNASASGIFGGLLNIFKIFNVEYIKAFLNIWIGQLSTASIMSCGMFIFGSIVGVIIIFNTIQEKNIVEDKIILGIMAIFGIFCNYGMLGMQSITWLEHAKETIDLSKITTIVNASNNFSRVFVYMRYFAPFMGIIMFVSIIYILEQKETFKIFKLAYLYVIVGQIYWIEYILPILEKNITTATVYIPFSGAKYNQECSLLVYIPATYILIASMTLIGYFLYQRKKKWILMILLASIIYQYLYYGYIHENEWHNRANSGYELVRKIEKHIDVKEDIYVPYEAMAYTYQVMLFDYKINKSLPDDEREQALLFTNKYVVGENDYRYNEYIFEKGYVSFKLDWNEYVYVKGKDLIKTMKVLGY